MLISKNLENKVIESIELDDLELILTYCQLCIDDFKDNDIVRAAMVRMEEVLCND